MSSQQNDYIQTNKEGYDRIYRNGWGNRYADTNLISIYYNNIRPLLNKDDAKVIKCLDFGCSLGSNTVFFRDVGMDVYGIDISSVAIEKCVSKNNFPGNKFIAANVLDNDSSIRELFTDIYFDLIIASNVLYYFSDEGIYSVLKQFDNAMTEGGVIYANMHTVNSYFFTDKNMDKNGMYILEDSGSIDSVTYMKAVKDKIEMRKLFDLFECKHILYSNFEAVEDKFTEDFHYIGVKR